jgi:hypothetical protein
MTTNRLIATLVVFAVALPIAYVMDRNTWRKRPREELDRRVRSKDWRKMHPALKELKRRGEQLMPYLPEVLGLMASDSSMTRSAGLLALKDFFPSIAREIPAFSPTGPASKRDELLVPLLAKYGTPPKREPKAT